MVGMSQREHMQTVRDVAHLNAFSHAMAARDGRQNRPVSLRDFGLAGLGDDSSSSDSGSSFTWDNATDILSAATQGTAAIIGALNQQPTTVIAGGSTVPYGYQTPRVAINPATGLPYATTPTSVSGNSMMTYLFLGGIALVAVMVLSKKKSAPASS